MRLLAIESMRQQRLGGFLVPGGNRFLYFLDGGAQFGAQAGIGVAALGRLTRTFLG
jgi:hypothetical protein